MGQRLLCYRLLLMLLAVATRVQLCSDLLITLVHLLLSLSHAVTVSADSFKFTLSIEATYDLANAVNLGIIDAFVAQELSLIFSLTRSCLPVASCSFSGFLAASSSPLQEV